MQRQIKLIVMLVVFLGLAGCVDFFNYDETVHKLALSHPRELDLAKTYLDMAQAHNLMTIEERLDPSLKSAQTHSLLEQVAGLFPAEMPKSVKLIGFQTYTLFPAGEPDAVTTTIAFEYEFTGRWLQAVIGLKGVRDNTTITTFRVTPLRQSLETMYRFTLADKDLKSYLFLAATIAVPAFIFIVLVTCIRTSIPKRKWLWLVFILVGFPTFQFNWYDGTLRFNPLSAQLVGVSFPDNNPYNPLILAVSIPVGAALFIFRRRQWKSPKTLG